MQAFSSSQSILSVTTLPSKPLRELMPPNPCSSFVYSYFDIIKQPMDLSNMTTKLSQGLYKNRFEFEADFRLMVNNARQYNLVGSYVHNEAITLENIFDKRTFPVYSLLSTINGFVAFRVVTHQ
jgi:transcription initiation factor TFIID subunit 2